MSQIVIAVIDPSQSEKTNMEVPDDVDVRSLTEAMIEQMGMPTRGANGRRILYQLNLREEDGRLRRLDDNQTLAENGVQNDAVLQLITEARAGCFTAGTLVTLADKRQIPIEDLKIGDWLLSYSTTTRALSTSQVTDTYRGREACYLEINDILQVTPSHIVYVNENWQRAETLRPGDHLLNNSTQNVSVEHVLRRDEEIEVFNLSLSNDSTFFAQGFLVHNLNAKRYSNTKESLLAGREGFKTPPITFNSYFSPEKNRDNLLSDLAQLTVDQLANLEELDLSAYELTALPSQVSLMVNLRRLFLSGNMFTKFPKEIFSLNKLEYLDLSFNHFTQLPREIARLSGLKSLILSGNPISRLPREIVWLQQLNLLGLEDMQIQVPPPEIIGQGIKAIKNYLRNLTETKKLYEAKLIIVGEGAVGKTCIVKKLVNPDYDIKRNENSIVTTEGIEITEWVFDTSQISDFHVNIWDFGGQEIYHATHQFFLTKRSLYLFVWDARKEDRLGAFDYWLSAAKLLSDQSPVIVVLNKADERVKEIDQAGLKSKFPNIISFIKVSALTNQGMEDLSHQIKENIIKLPHVGSDWSKTWAEIRHYLETDNRDYIDRQEYLSICRKFGLNEEQAITLSGYLHDLGVILHFQEDPILQNIVVLKPEWGTQAVYRVLDTKSVQEKKGRFYFSDLGGIWSDQRYPPQKHMELLQLMIRFELCFRLIDANEYIVPELLSPERPKHEIDDQNSLRFEYHYNFMPAGIIARFIVRNHYLILGELYWQLGAVLEREGTQALIFCEPLDKKLKISISGDNRPEMLAIIRNELSHIHQTLNNPDVKEMIPCICRECKLGEASLYDYEVLRRYSLRGKTHITCPKSIEDISVQELIQGVIRTSKETINIAQKLNKEQGTPISITVQGDYVAGGKTVTDKKISITDSTVHGSIVAAESIKESFNVLEKASIKEDLKEQLKQLTQAVEAMIKELPKEQAEELAEDMKVLAEEATKERPSPRWYNVSIEGLIAAAQNLGKVGDAVIELAGKVRNILTGGLL